MLGTSCEVGQGKHRPDMTLGDTGAAVELKYITYAGLKEAIGQGFLYRRFYGYGNYDAPYCLIGMEEGGCDSPEGLPGTRSCFRYFDEPKGPVSAVLRPSIRGVMSELGRTTNSVA